MEHIQALMKLQNWDDIEKSAEISLPDWWHRAMELPLETLERDV